MKNKTKIFTTLVALCAIGLNGNFIYGQTWCLDGGTCGADAGADKTYHTCCTGVTIGGADCSSGTNSCPNGNSSAGVTYSWSPTAGLSCSTCCNPVASPNSTTTYTLTVNYACNQDCCCKDCCNSSCSSGCTNTCVKKDQVVVTVTSQNSCCRIGNPEQQKEVNAGNYNLYPNPNAGIFSVELGQENTNVSVYVYDMSGKNVWLNENVADKMVHINISNLPKGSYFIQVKNGEKIMFYKKIMM